MASCLLHSGKSTTPCWDRVQAAYEAAGVTLNLCELIIKQQEVSESPWENVISFFHILLAETEQFIYIRIQPKQTMGNMCLFVLIVYKAAGIGFVFSP